MSAPARSVKTAARPATAPARTPARRPARPAPRRAPAPARKRPSAAQRARLRRKSIAFVVMSAVIVTALVLGLVALQALLAQESFKVDDLQSRVDTLTRLNEQYGLAAARLASPSRIAAEARNLGMTLPASGTVVLHVSSGPPAASPHHKAVAGVRP